jgi:methanogenic corrinoid protein MtbC1
MMKTTINALEEAGLRDHVKITMGGASASTEKPSTVSV